MSGVSSSGNGSGSWNDVHDNTATNNTIGSKRSHSDIDDTNNSTSDNQRHKNEKNENHTRIENGEEIYESKKYRGKYYIMDSKTNAAIWIEIKLSDTTSSTTSFDTSLFNSKSNLNLFYFFDPRNNEKKTISKANFATTQRVNFIEKKRFFILSFY